MPLHSCLTVCAVSVLLIGQDSVTATTLQGEPNVAATVANQVITVAEAEAFFERTIGERVLTENVKLELQAKALEQLVGQLLVMEYLRTSGKLASDEDVQLALERLQEELASIEQSLEKYLAQQRLTRNGLTNRTRFQMSWQRYLDSTLTEDNLRRHFENHLRELDGSQMRVSHLLLKTNDIPTEDLGSILDQVAQIRQQVTEGKIAWVDAVRTHSQAATRDSGGDLGWIGRLAPMPESFSAAAFQLEPGQISPPLRTGFGVHLIRCEEIKPGDLNFENAEPEIRRHAVQYLFQWIVARQSEQTPPRYSGLFPYWDAKTGKVMVARPSSDRPEH